MRALPTPARPSFEDLKQVNAYGAEYWSARDLQPLLGYDQWRRFEQVIARAQDACKGSGNEPGDHFAGAGKMVPLGSGSERKLEDYHLSRFACYLIALNGDPRKPEIALAQQYFVVVTKRSNAFIRTRQGHATHPHTTSPHRRLAHSAQHGEGGPQHPVG